MSTGYLLIFCQSVIALVFAVSAIGKARDMKAFKEAIISFQLLPKEWSQSMAWLFLIVEIAIVISMLPIVNLLSFGFLLATLVLFIFAAALAIALRRKQKVMCNCFGQTENYISVYDVVRNLIIISCSLTGFFISGITYSSFGRLSVIDTILVGLVGAIFVTFLISLSEIVTLYNQPSIKIE